jgi:clathrin heavy chain
MSSEGQVSDNDEAGANVLVTADSAIMHPKEKIIALKCECPPAIPLTLLAGRQLQVFNLATKSKLGSHLMNEDVGFWTWINDSTLGLVTDREVLHWKVIEGQAAPTKVSRDVRTTLTSRSLTDMPR